jgi:hypothetical protein
MSLEGVMRLRIFAVSIEDVDCRIPERVGNCDDERISLIFLERNCTTNVSGEKIEKKWA